MKKALLLTLLFSLGAIAMSGCVVSQADSVPASSFFAGLSSWTIFNLFVFGGLGFWIYCSVWLVILICYCTDDEWRTPIILIAVGLVIMWLVGAFNPFMMLFKYAYANPWVIVGIIVGYIVIGLVYASIKLKLLSISLAEKYGKHLEWFLNHKNIKGAQIPDDLLREWDNSCDTYSVDNKPSLEKYKEKLLFWWVWWPLSMPHTILREFVVRLYENLYNFCKGYFERILLSSFAKFNQPKSKGC
ncbi:MAG: hypothetical protein WC473_00380 [Patescibacteria group bacterium]|jgi:uncharacterized membrane protein